MLNVGKGKNAVPAFGEFDFAEVFLVNLTEPKRTVNGGAEMFDELRAIDEDLIAVGGGAGVVVL